MLLLWGLQAPSQIMPGEASSNEMQNFKSMEPVASKCPACFKAAHQGNFANPLPRSSEGGGAQLFKDSSDSQQQGSIPNYFCYCDSRFQAEHETLCSCRLGSNFCWSTKPERLEAYNLIRMKEGHKYLSVFNTGYGKFKYR